MYVLLLRLWFDLQEKMIFSLMPPVVI